MSEEAPEPVEPMPQTGVPEVDSVLADVEAVQSRPVDEHVAVFDNAHQRLRRALDGDSAPDAG